MQLHPSTTSTDEAQEAEPPRVLSLRRRLLWTGGIMGVLLLLVFVPPLFNVNRYRRQIANSMSASLGRPVHLDNVSMHLLPTPGFTLSNFVVSEDPAFGTEPTIRADSVEGTLRLVSLWRRPVEFSTVRFIEPHVNLVRNAQGRWNLADVLLHASHLRTAPTDQTHAGPAPRFPYIEATGGRVNVKMGEEKLPFSITDADFALWLPSPNQWRVRLKGEPARTDTNLSDPGTLRIEGGLQKAETATGIPVNFHATWHDAPLGEASRLLTGDDLGWRGTLNWDATLEGTLSEARLSTQITLGGLRRAEFAAQQPLDLQITCGGRLAVARATADGLRCEMPDSAPAPMLLQAESVDLERPMQTAGTLDGDGIPLHWGMLWAALFSTRVPTDLHPAGQMEIHLRHVAPGQVVLAPAAPMRKLRGRSFMSKAATSGSTRVAWAGEVDVKLPAAPGVAAIADSRESASFPTTLIWRPIVVASVSKPGQLAAATGLGFAMQPATIPLGGDSTMVVGATLGPAGYTVAASGTANAAALLLPAKYLPQTGDGMEKILPYPPTSLDPARVEFSCNHPWGALQSCTSSRPAPSGSRKGAVVGMGTPATALRTPQPSLLTPQSLSPYDRNPPLGTTPSSGSASPSTSPHP